MKLEIKKGSENYCCTVVKIDNLHAIEGADFIQRTVIFGNNVIIGKDIKEGDIITYPSVENYYQGMKSGHPKILKLFSEMTPSKAKFNGKHLELRKDWEQVKFDVMEKALRIKFAPGTKWYIKLKETEDEIVEWNNWGDRIWGKTLDGKGENYLGKILMKIRDEQK